MSHACCPLPAHIGYFLHYDDQLSLFVMGISSHVFGALPIPLTVALAARTFKLNLQGPLKLFFAVPSACRGHMTAHARGLTKSDVDCLQSSTAEHIKTANPALCTRPFLPLCQPRFNPYTAGSWSRLTDDIQHWLNVIFHDRTHYLWQWGVDIFWISFVGTFPEFPLGDRWPEYNPRIPFRSEFLDSWMHNYRQYRHGDPDTLSLRIRVAMWEQLSQRVSLLRSE